MGEQKEMKSLLNWELDQTAFYNQIVDMIKRSHKNGKVIPLPIAFQPGIIGVNQLSLLVSQVNCDRCDARCCKEETYGSPIEILPPEYSRLQARYGRDKFYFRDNKPCLIMPCTFLYNERCSIYLERPLVCPFQPGARDGNGNVLMAVASICPEARRIAQRLYMVEWQMRQQFGMLGNDSFIEGILGE